MRFFLPPLLLQGERVGVRGVYPRDLCLWRRPSPRPSPRKSGEREKKGKRGAERGQRPLRPYIFVTLPPSIFTT